MYDQGPKLKVVTTMSAGYEHLDVPEIKRRGIKVGHTPKVLSDAVAETAVMLMLAAARRLQEGRLKLEQYRQQIQIKVIPCKKIIFYRTELKLFLKFSGLISSFVFFYC